MSKFKNYLNEAVGVKDLDSVVRKVLRELGMTAAKFSTTAVRGYLTKSKAGVMTQSDSYEFRVDTHTMGSGWSEKGATAFREKLKEVGLTWTEKHGAFIFNRKENELPPEYNLSPEAMTELLNPGKVLYQDRSAIRERPELDKIYNELSFKGLAETKRTTMPRGRGKAPLVVYRTLLTKKGEKARHLLSQKGGK
jgi:hypothetical protein